jgi:hypothetical protein
VLWTILLWGTWFAVFGASYLSMMLVGAFLADAPDSAKRAERSAQIAQLAWIGALILGGMLIRSGVWWKMLLSYVLAAVGPLVLIAGNLIRWRK